MRKKVKYNFGSKKKLLKDVTLVVLSKDRHQYLIGLLNYWKNTNISIIILDNTKKSLKYPSSLTKKIKLNYIHCYKKSVFKRLNIASHKIKSKFTLLHHDDDLYFKSTIIKGVNFLSKHNDYSAVRGLEFNFNLDSKKNITGRLNEDISEVDSLDQSNFLDRKNKMIKKFRNGPLYSLTRTEVWIKTQSFLYTNKLSYYYVWEIFLALSIIYFGKFKILNSPFLLRNGISIGQRYDDETTIPENNLYTFITNSTYKKKISIYKKFFLLKKINPRKINFLINDMKLTLDFFLNKDYKNYKKPKKWKSFLKYYYRLKGILNISLKRKIYKKKLYSILKKEFSSKKNKDTNEIYDVIDHIKKTFI